MAAVPMNGRLILAAFLASLLLHPGCGGSPFAPDPLPAPGSGSAAPLPPPALPLQPAASLVIERLTASGVPLRNSFLYLARFLIRETSGTSGATIKKVHIGSVAGGGDGVTDDCWGGGLRVPPGGTLDTFFTEDGRYWLGYCEPGGASPTQVDTVWVTVTFHDDSGVIGTATADITPRH